LINEGLIHSEELDNYLIYLFNINYLVLKVTSMGYWWSEVQILSPRPIQ